MEPEKPPFERALLAGVVGVATLLPWHGGFGRSSAWTTSLEILGASLPLWLVFPLVVFSVSISWGAHRRWHDLPRDLPVVLDGAAVLLAGAALLVGRPGAGTLLGFIAIAVIGATDVAALRRTRAFPIRPETSAPDRVARMRRMRRFRARLRVPSVRPADAAPEESGAESRR
ncbi:MAG: hypothetical protein K8T90_21655 [Planctomycetes bacterium]|nr:hypothetical protein [Planctomycetota bacterium]